MAKLNTIAKSKTRRIVVYGPPKSGKTLLAGAMAEKMNVLYIGLENGHNTLFQLPEEWQSRIEVIALPDSKGYPIGIETVMKIFSGNPCSVCEEHGKVNCPICTKEGGAQVKVNLKELDESWVVVLDSATQLTASAIAFICKGQPDTYKMLTDDWGSLGKYLDAVFSQVQAARYNVVVLSHEIDVADEKKPEKLVPLAGSKNFSRNFAKFFDDVVHCKVTNKKHTFGSSTGYSLSALTGSRSDFNLEESMEPKLLDFFYPEEAKKKPKVVVAAK